MSDVISSIVQAIVGGAKAIFGMWAEVVREVERTVDAGGLRAVQVQASSGSIHYQGVDPSVVTVRAWVTVRGPSQGDAEEFAQRIEVRTDREEGAAGHTLRVHAEVPRPHVGYSVSVRYEVSGPRALAADLRTSSGGIHVSGTEGAVKAYTSSGRIELEGGKGDIDLHTDSGGIRVDRAEGQVRAEATSGSIELREGVGAVDLRTRSGGIRATLNRLEGEGTFSAQSGSIHVEVGAGIAPITATTSSGAVHVTLPAGYAGQLEARTSSGSVRCDLPVFTASESGQNHVRGRIGEGGEATVKLHTSSGGVHIQ
jgi:DUF4097 and DUF4098 domain-containing protein YvlB